jgi:hypothetical protein
MQYWSYEEPVVENYNNTIRVVKEKKNRKNRKKEASILLRKNTVSFKEPMNSLDL